VAAVEEDNAVFFIDAASGKVEFKIRTEGENPEHAVFSPDGKRVFVSAEESPVVDVIEVGARKLAGAIRVGKRARHRLYAGRRTRLRGLRDRQHRVRNRCGRDEGP
ncbi:MAG TPA: hypothetical protein VFR86_30385, partial [Burkholderiaceae bacterium]|nr:hypothetical protein [Burkholderiaceae bacterium]